MSIHVEDFVYRGESLVISQRNVAHLGEGDDGVLSCDEAGNLCSKLCNFFPSNKKEKISNTDALSFGHVERGRFFKSGVDFQHFVLYSDVECRFAAALFVVVHNIVVHKEPRLKKLKAGRQRNYLSLRLFSSPPESWEPTKARAPRSIFPEVAKSSIVAASQSLITGSWAKIALFSSKIAAILLEMAFFVSFANSENDVLVLEFIGAIIHQSIQ